VLKATQPIIRGLTQPLTAALSEFTDLGILNAPYLGQVTTRVMLPNRFSSSLKYANGRRAHFARDDIVALQVIVPNFYINAPVGETGTGGVLTTSVSIEYPLGTRTQVPFGGATYGSVPDNSYLISDVLPIAIPNGSLLYAWEFWNNPAGFAYASYNSSPAPYLSEAYEYSATSLLDKTLSGTIIKSDANNVNVFGCCGIIAYTRRPSIYIGAGADSRAFGYEHAPNNPDLGEIADAVGGTFAYMLHAIPSAKVSIWNASHANQLALSQFCSDIVLQGGINDINSPATAATVLAARDTARAYFPSSKRVHETTLPPHTASSDGFTTLGGQTLASTVNNAQRVAFNDAVRAGRAGYAGYFDIADAVESSRNSGLWNCPVAGGGTAPAVLTSGLHELKAGNDLIASSGVVNLGAFHRP